MPYRISCPPALEDVEDPYAAVLRAQALRAQRLRIGAAVALLVGGVSVARVATSASFADAEAARSARRAAEAIRVHDARAAIDGARRRAESEQVRFEGALRGAIAADVGPRSDLGACPIALPGSARAPEVRSVIRVVRRGGSFPLLTVHADELDGPLPSQAVAGVLSDVQRAEAHLAAGRFEEATLYARALDRPERFTYDVVLLTRASKEARALPGNAYEPGELEGRAYLYDFPSGQVVCAGDVRAKSSRSIGYVYSDRLDSPVSLSAVASMTDAIRDDIRQQTEHAIAENLVFRAGPNGQSHSGL